MSNVDLLSAVNDLFSLPESMEKYMLPQRPNEVGEKNRGTSSSSIPVDIMDAPKEYIFYMDLPGLTKTDIQITVEDDNTLVIKSGGKRKHDEVEEENCKYIRLERKAPQKLLRKFKLPENANVSAITAKCENGVLTVVVEKLPAPKPKTVQVTIS